MADPKGFLKVERIENRYRPIDERVQDYLEVETPLPGDMRCYQASRCMDCGVPFCHWACPLGSMIPEWQDKLRTGDWQAAYNILQKTTNFPEFTGRLCPAPCEHGCVLGINDEPVTICENELAIVERAFATGYVQPIPPEHRTGKTVAVIGSGPAGLACADTLNQIGHTVVLYEAADAAGGYLRYGVPDFKLEKRYIDRRLELLIAEGLDIRTGVTVGRDIAVDDLRHEFDAVCLAIGARAPRDVNIPGRDLNGVHLAMAYLEQQNRVVDGEIIPAEERITAQGKRVIVLGGGDTGSDCIGTANRQGAKSVTQIELVPEFPRERPASHPWPLFPRLYKVTSSHEEGCERMFSILTQAFIGGKKQKTIKKIRAVRLSWGLSQNGRAEFTEIPDSTFERKADLVLLALGFVHVEQTGLITELELDLDPRGNIAINTQYMTSQAGVFAAGDANRGASLVVWALHEGRSAARAIDAYLRSS